MTMNSVTIILAEDDDGHASLVQRNLERAGLSNSFVRVRDGQELLDCLCHHQCPEGLVLGEQMVVLLDINMPRIDGIEALRQLKANPQTQKIPVIMLTTTDDPREVDRCYELGCNVYITKPVEYEGFIEAVRRLGLFLQIVQRPRNGGS
jgi:CheY-like chemotaxis protein